jgi:hypothetical protein
MSTEIDRIPVQELQSRFGIKISALYNRLEKSGIKPIKVGRRSFITAEQLEVLDRLDRFIKDDGTIDDFLSKQNSSHHSLEASSDLSSVLPSELSQQQDAIAALVQLIGNGSVPITIQCGSVSDRFAYYRVLDEAAEEGWELMSSEVAELLKLDVEAIKRFGEEFQQAGFVFSRASAQRRGELCWRVLKLRNS